jgi:PHD-finger
VVPLTIFFQFSADIEARLHKAKVAILQAQERLEAISGQSRHRKFTEAKENELSVILRRWVLQVRSQVLVPSDVSKAELARPPFGVCLSQPMKDVVESASCLGLADLPDIPLMENYFKCMSWSLTALAFIRRKPSIEEVDYIISTSDGLRLPDERALRTLKYISNRANQIQIRCQKALSPKSGDTKSINISLLQEILKGAEELPVVVPETQILQLVIDDKGARHCYCGGPNDGLEMLRCDGCQKWFHRGCVGGDASPIEENWLCQSCGGANRDSRVENTPSRAFEPKEPSTMDPTTSPHAPDPKKLWPPFGLLGSKKAVHALGPECSAIAEGSDVLPSEQQEHSGTLGTQLTTAQNKIPSSTVTSDTSQLQIERMEARRPSENSASTALNGGTSVSGEAKDANSTDHAFLETRPLGFL